MTFNAIEISTQDGRPITLYAFRWGKTYWRYTSADRDITRDELVNNVLQSVTYAAKTISDNGMVQGSSQQNDFSVSAQSDLPIVSLFQGTPPSETIWLTVRRTHVGDEDAPIAWKGLILNVKRPDLAKCLIVGKPLAATLKRTGLRLCWSRECPHYLYDPGCKVDPEAYAVVTTVAALTGSTITIPATTPLLPEYYRGGFVAWEANADGTIERRMIHTQPGQVLTVLGLTDRLTAGQEIKLYPGCDRTPETCAGKFNNLDNYGGFDKMPGESPFNKAIW